MSTNHHQRQLRQSRKISELPKTQQPREKLASLGVANLSDAELLALILGSGTDRHNVVQLAHVLLQAIPLIKLKQLTTPDRLTRLRGIGRVQAGKIVASLELARRLSNFETSVTIRTSAQAYHLLTGVIHKQREYVIGLYLNARHELLLQETLAVGGLNANHLEPRDVFGPALKLPCVGLILAHNHPSGDPQPSQDDLQLTEVLQTASELLGIELIDHLILGRGCYVSLREKGIL